MKKIVAVSFLQESNTFSPVKCRYDDFTISYGDDMFTDDEVKRCLDRPGYAVVPTLSAVSLPGGIVAEQSFLRIENEILARIPDDPDIAGVWLDLHGAMQAENIGSGEAHLVSEIRKKVGAGVPITAALDFHANISEALIGSVNILCGYKTAPHTDEIATQIKAAELLFWCIENKVMPKPVMVRIPLLLPGEMATTGIEPLKSLLREVEKTEEADGILCSTFFCGMAWVDSPDTGACIVSVLKDGPETIIADIKRVAGLFYEAKERFRFEEESADPEKALDMAVGTKGGPVFVTDSGDNVTAGAPGDSISLLEMILKKHIAKILVAGITDEKAYTICESYNTGDTVNFDLGWTLTGDGRNIRVSGTLVWKGKVYDACSGNHVDSATVRIDNADVVITKSRCSFISPDSFVSADLMISEYHIIVVKLGYLFDQLRKVSYRTVMALTQGCSCLLVEKFEYKHVKRPIYPLDKELKTSGFFSIFSDICKGLVGFVKGELILMCVTFIILLVGLIIIKAPVPYLIALGITVFDLMPVVGSGMIMIPWAVISLIAGNTRMAAGVAVLYLILIMARELLEPIIVGSRIGIRPLYIFLASVAGSMIFGPFGFIIGPVLAIIFNSIYKLTKKDVK